MKQAYESKTLISLNITKNVAHKNRAQHRVHRTSAGIRPHFRGSGPNGGFGVWWLYPPIPALAGNACWPCSLRSRRAIMRMEPTFTQKLRFFVSGGSSAAPLASKTKNYDHLRYKLCNYKNRNRSE
jgi:hypothetical protein